jgi:predicted Zn-dependent protease
MRTPFPNFRAGAARFPALVCIASFLFAAAPSNLIAVTEPSALTGQRQSYAYSWQQEVKEGADADKEITQQMGLYDNPRVQEYVQAVGRRVLAASTFSSPNTPEMYRNTQFTFRVLDTPVVNAFALPGGYVYVTRGLLSHVDNEAQLAVVIGHEIGHVAARHASQQARRSQWSKLGVIAGAILGQAVLGDKMPNFAQNVMSTGSQAMQVFMLRYSREAENEADTLGVGYALNAGYAAEQSPRFFDALRRLAAEEGSGLPTWMSSHPDPGNRADHVMALVNERRSGPAERFVGENEFLSHVDGMIVGEDPRQGFAQNGTFYHPTLHFQLPVAPSWKVDNQPTAVVFSEPNGRAVMGLRMAPANRTHDAVAQFVSENKVQVSASGDTVVNGLPASVVVGRATTQQGEVGVWDAFVEMEGKVYSLLGYAPAAQFEQMRPTFESIASGFSPLRDPRLASVQPARLRIVRADRPAPFAAFVPTSLPPNFTAESVAIMNQVGLNENVPPGVALKIPDVSAAQTNTEVLATAPPPAAPQYPTNYPTSNDDSARYPNRGYPAPNYPDPSRYPTSTSPYPNDERRYPPYPTAPTYPSPGDAPRDSYPPAPSPSYPPQYPNASGYPPAQYPQTQYPTNQYPQTPYPQNTPPNPNSGTSSGYPPPQWPR